MALENAKEFLKKAMKDKDLYGKIIAADTLEVTLTAKELGFDVTEDELEQAERELKQLSSVELPSELASDELDKVAGGRGWQGEDAPDGHEMGCAIFYHKRGYSEETGIWCNQEYYCIANNHLDDDKAKDYYGGY